MVAEFTTCAWPAAAVLYVSNRLPPARNARAAKKPEKFKAELLEIFGYWKEAWGKNEQAKLTPKRKKAVLARLKEGYTVDQIKLAIYGCSVTPHNNGTDPKGDGRIYDCLELICRSGDNVERFAGNASAIAPPAQQKQSDAVSDALTNINDTDW